VLRRNNRINVTIITGTPSGISVQCAMTRANEGVMPSTAKVGFFTRLKSTLLSVGGKEGDEGAKHHVVVEGIRRRRAPTG